MLLYLVCIEPEFEPRFDEKYFISKKLAEADLKKRNKPYLEPYAKIIEITTED